MMSADYQANESAGAAPSTATSPISLNYAQAALFKKRPSRVDGLALFFAVGQLGIVILILVSTLESRNGFSEIRDPTWWKWLAWQAQWGLWMIWAWGIGSVVAIIGAMHPPGRRRRWYVAYCALAVGVVVVCLTSMLVLNFSGAEERWVSTWGGSVDRQRWREVEIAPSFYWQVPVSVAITNPVLVLIAFRTALRSRSTER
jgi:hypothetical protein